jgi:cbb3-type cytochrome oxidase subunit 1
VTFVNRLSLRFIRWGTGLLVLGLLTGYGPLHHYMHGGVEVACPWAPVHGHVVLLGWVGFTLFGLVYRALPDWGTPTAAAVRIAGIHLWVSVLAVLGIYGNGIFGYRYLDRLSPSFYYKPDAETLRLWLSIDGWFLTLFAVGCFLFMWVVFSTTRQQPEKGTTVI